jgi:AraC-like DNA-binding protein
MQDPSTAIQAVLVQGFLVFALRHGVAPEDVCRTAGVPFAELRDPERLVPYAWVDAIWHVLEELLPELELGMELGLFWTFDRLGYLGEAIRNSASLLEVLDKCVRVAQVLDHGARMAPVSLEQHDDTVSLTFPSAIAGGVVGRLEMLAVAVVTQLRTLSGENVCPTHVRLAYHKPTLRTRYRDFFGCEVEFDCETNELVFERVTLALPVLGAQLGARAQAHCEGYLERSVAQNKRAELLDSVRHAIASQLTRGALSGNGTARALGLSHRSLQRKLVSAGTSYRELADEGRKDAALRLLQRTGANVHDVASALGYQDLGSFVQAFRRWTGKSPSEYRKHGV